jgi:hypothetical protein
MKTVNTIALIAALGIVGLWVYAVGCTWRTNLDTLFSGLAFVGIIYSIFFQSQELKATHKDLERSAIAQEKSQVELTRQFRAMNVTALLAGNQALAEHYNAKAEEAKLHVDPNERERFKQKASEAIARIEQLIGDTEARSKELLK